MIYAVIDTNILVSSRISKNPLAATVKVVANVFQNRIIPVFNEEILSEYYEVGENGAFPPTRNGCIHSLSMRERG